MTSARPRRLASVETLTSAAIAQICANETADMILSGEWLYNFDTHEVAVAATATPEFRDYARESLIAVIAEER